ncbi:MAG TPA: hypothetical protein VG734_08570 [Lacunisphaera sp.]|nr:hypothetical protein [Lacunisphaera sp.]
MNVIEAIKDPNLLGSFLGDDLDSWRPWHTALRVLYGLDVWSEEARALVQQCTGRDPDLMPEAGFDVAEFLTGRRSGKSRIAAIVGAFESLFAGHDRKLAKGERGLVAVLAPTKKQAGIVHGYLRGIFDAPLLRGEVIAETADGFDLKNGLSVVVLAGDWRTIRGFTLVCVVIDEAAFFGLSEESKVKSDTELIRAVRPGLATTKGRLIVISSPYARRGWCFTTHQKNFGNNAGTVLVWNAPSRVMNPTLPQSVVDAALAEDLAAAMSEYLGEFRDDIGAYVSRELVEAAVVRGRTEISPSRGVRYSAFVDMSGGRNDDAALAIGHRTQRKVVIDFTKRYRPPFNPHAVIGEMAEELKRYGLRQVQGDNYAADYTVSAFASYGIRFIRSEKPRSALYLELLPRICSGEVELLDDEVLVGQIASLERRTRSGGKDIIDHPPGGHDDIANSVAGVTDIAAAPRRIVGAISDNPEQ